MPKLVAQVIVLKALSILDLKINELPESDECIGREFEKLKAHVSTSIISLYTKLIENEMQSYKTNDQSYQGIIEVFRNLECNDFNEIIKFTADLGIDLATQYPYNFAGIKKEFNQTNDTELISISFDN